MARYPAAIWLPIDETYIGRRPLAPQRMNLHVAVSEAPSLHAYFNAPKRPSSHFYVRKDGTVEQYQDTAWSAEADLEGNGSTISVETQGGVTSPQSEPWTPAQVESLARLYAWAVTTHGLPLRLATDSRPGTSSTGLSWHRLGIDPWRVDGGLRYSMSSGKICPGDAKISQIPGVLRRAQEILAPAATRPRYPSPFTRTLRRGTFGDDVGSLHKRLAVCVSLYWRVVLGPQRRQFDTRTERVVRAFQKSRGLTVDGIAGPKTLWTLATTYQEKTR